jgi:hypothetical protein
MRIHLQRPSAGISGGPEATKPPARQLGTEQDRVSLNASARLESELEAEPPARPEAVARAKGLLQNQSYPSPAVLRAVSDHLAAKLK